MVVGRILSPLHSLGPGERVGLWTQGCGRGCPGCVAPELQSPAGPEIPEGELAAILGKVADMNSCGGLTVSGGEPFAQPEALLGLLGRARSRFSDILVYTGYTLEEIAAGAAGEAGRACLALIDVLIDGPYVRERNTPECALRGSDNQRIIYLDESKRASYEAYMGRGRVLETFAHGGTTIVTGILNDAEKEAEQ